MHLFDGRIYLLAFGAFFSLSSSFYDVYADGRPKPLVCPDGAELSLRQCLERGTSKRRKKGIEWTRKYRVVRTFGEVVGSRIKNKSCLCEYDFDISSILEERLYKPTLIGIVLIEEQRVLSFSRLDSPRDTWIHGLVLRFHLNRCSNSDPGQNLGLR